MKTCFSCHIYKPLSEFYTHNRMADGHLNKCKSCVKSSVAARVKSKSSDLAWSESERARSRDKAKRARDNGTASPSMPESSAKWRAANTLKRKAHVIVGNAVRDGLLTPEPCCKCGGKAQAHHEDYSLPLEVIWYCPTHHGERHVEINKQRRLQVLANKHK